MSEQQGKYVTFGNLQAGQRFKFEVKGFPEKKIFKKLKKGGFVLDEDTRLILEDDETPKINPDTLVELVD
jgi:hypothetical protein